VEEIGRIRTVEKVQLLQQGEYGIRVRVTHRTPDFWALSYRLGLLPRCPFWVENGITTWTVTAVRGDLRRFLDSLSGMVLSMRIEAILPTASVPDRTVLTRRQSELLRCAISEGYFDVPRKVSLTKLAIRVGVSKSTLSRTLAVVEWKLIQASVEPGQRLVPDSDSIKPVR
jgi:predicted DNA binding protein